MLHGRVIDVPDRDTRKARPMIKFEYRIEGTDRWTTDHAYVLRGAKARAMSGDTASVEVRCTAEYMEQLGGGA